MTAALCRTCGTLTYLSPEMSLKMAYSHAVDCWAVGIVLYVLLCGWARLLRLRQAVARSARWHSQRCPNALLRVPQKIVKPLAGVHGKLCYALSVQPTTVQVSAVLPPEAGGPLAHDRLLKG